MKLAEADVACFDPDALFGRKSFDRVVISYALSMIPLWREVLHRAAGLLAPGCTSSNSATVADCLGP